MAGLVGGADSSTEDLSVCLLVLIVFFLLIVASVLLQFLEALSVGLSVCPFAKKLPSRSKVFLIHKISFFDQFR
uniref:Uncharacterized protein n=1 Tax=Caenorhabditis japonica TaxID=281687 RepID=A0A8R1EEC2_CAEJA